MVFYVSLEHLQHYAGELIYSTVAPEMCSSTALDN